MYFLQRFYSSVNLGTEKYVISERSLPKRIDMGTSEKFQVPKKRVRVQHFSYDY